MPRRVHSSNAKNTNTKPPVAKSPLPPPPKINHQEKPSMMGGLLGTVAQGFAFGTGSSIAHRGVDAMMGNNTIQETDTDRDTERVSKKSDFDACKILFTQYQKCLESEWNAEACVAYKEKVDKCMEFGTP